jgi:hypothetical protein
VEAAAFVALGGLAAKLLSRDVVVRIENRSVIRGFVDFVDQRWVQLVRSFGH